jgi:hypothetical protein
MRRSAMTQPFGAQSAAERIPLSAEEKARAEVNFTPYVAEAHLARGQFRVSADTPEMMELFQQVARRVGDTLRRPVVSYANGREIVIAFGPEEPPGVTGQGAPPVELRLWNDRLNVNCIPTAVNGLETERLDKADDDFLICSGHCADSARTIRRIRKHEARIEFHADDISWTRSIIEADGVCLSIISTVNPLRGPAAVGHYCVKWPIGYRSVPDQHFSRRAGGVKLVLASDVGHLLLPGRSI